ncbi:MAG: penicillin-binding protein [Rhodocyclales bacterium CG17_big_fil_post_rev_8_21_14_2_50_68_7]|nr:MAG: penicillin-binding protein [Betaproteobacteria bacterium CG2_30_68_42]PIV71700.1 MAG: penicillin-binding protein [Rhodocyclales bacterium CG17_big_fil_post_rev_8_21_14_2_50_68_7]PJA57083.1 MAG: penicillin-binding protein [Rhodocyclales bacterium CG_4_9_14_3_um_filter_68_10]
MPTILRWILYPIVVLIGAVLFALALGALAIIYAYPQLPSLEVLTDYRPKIPLRVYTSDGQMIGEFGEEHRSFVRIRDVPASMKQAILAAEDERFYQHAGVDLVGVGRAAWSNLIGGGKRQGASTITMQVARNFFLSSEKTLLRKLYEVLLAFKIEASLGKDAILQLYVNQIYLGQRAYGFAAASQTYFGKRLQDLNIAEVAMLAGLPKAPSAYNPIANPKRAKARQLYVLRRMREMGFIDDRQLADAQRRELVIRREAAEFGGHADHVAEMARIIAWEQFGEAAYSQGLRVITTITRADQQAAYAAVRRGVLDYDRRHGYRGAEGYVELPGADADQDEAFEDALQEYPDSDELLAALVLEAGPAQVRAWRRGGEIVRITGEGLRFAQRMLDDKAPPARRIRRGAVIRIARDGRGVWSIAQLPEAEAALVAASPVDGAVRALVGGFDFGRNKFNHVTQAWRQPGSSFKPFIYSAALERGYSPASIVEDSPLVISSAETGSREWEPKNYDGKYEGPMPLRRALAKSRNLVSVRLLRAIGTRYAQDYVTRFGFDADKHPPYLTMALGAGSVTPWQMLEAYGVFANGGYRVRAYVVQRILDAKGRVLARSEPAQAGDESMRVIDPRNAWLMDSMMHDVVRRGTGARAMVLKRGDLAGKTGTTNEYIDAWFAGYQPSLTAIAWIGFDQPKKLGNGETGSAAALPMWIAYMGQALKNQPEMFMPVPAGLVSIGAGGTGVEEYVYRENAVAAGGAPESVASEPAAAPVEERRLPTP